MLVKFEQNRMVQNTRNFELFDKKPGFFKPFLTKRWRHLEYISVAETIFNAKLLIPKLPSFSVQKITVTKFKVAPNMTHPISTKN